MMRQIGVDLEVNKAIEARRISFSEEPNDILRRVFGISPAQRKLNGGIPTTKERESRTRGDYKLKVLGRDVVCGSLKSVLREAMLTIEKQQPGFLEKLANHRRAKGRHIIARKPEELYPGKPQLVEYAERLDPRWWFDTNVSRRQTESYLQTMKEIGGVRDLGLQ